jgi:hypothetical protein
MDTNLIFLIITVILFIAILIFDFAFFRFRERKFDEGEPFNFLVQSTTRRVQAWLNAMQQPKSDEFAPLETEADAAGIPVGVRPAAQQGISDQVISREVQIPVAERPPVRVNITADVPEGTVVHITMQVTDSEGKISTQDSVIRGGKSSVSPVRRPIPVFAQRQNVVVWLVQQVTSLRDQGRLNHILFWGAIISYAIIISFAIDQWPIYFFTDEAIHMNMIADFLKNGFQNYDGEFLPTFFIKEGWVNGTSVYVQLLPYLIFGKSLIVTRLVSAFITLLGAIAIGLLLKKVLKTKYYWAGIFLLLTTPAWFLHARTAFEYAEVASFYCMFLYFYGRYRKGDMRSLYVAIFTAALCFYTHGLGQILTGITGLALFVIDFRYHIHPKRRATVLIGVGLALILLLPFVRYYLAHPTEIAEQIKRRGSYWSNPALPLPDKMLNFLGQYFYGLNPVYWYFENDIDFDRHIMRGLNNGLLITLPFMIIGFFQIFRTIRNVGQRLGIIAMITVSPILLSWFLHTFIEDADWKKRGVPFPNPFSATGEQTVIDPSQVFTIPASVFINLLWVAFALVLIGLILAFIKIRNPAHKLALIAVLACPFPASVAAIGMPRMLWMSVPLAILAGIGLSAAVRWLENHSKFKPAVSTVTLFACLVLLSGYILRTALVDGPIWFQDYGLYGMQFGAKQIFQDTVAPGLKNDPNVEYVVSPSWANGTEQFVSFFIPEEFQSRLHMGQPVDFVDNLDVFSRTKFVATADEFTNLLRDPKFVDVNVVQNIPYPNSQPGFYVVTMRPADNIQEILAQQHAENRTPIENTMNFNGESIRVIHSPLGSGSLESVFDTDPDSLVRVEEANPFFIAVYPNTPIDTHSVLIKTGSLHNYTITIRLYPAGGGEPVEYVQTYADEEGKELPPDPEQTIVFDRGPEKSERIEIEIKDNISGETSSIHLRTIQFK